MSIHPDASTDDAPGRVPALLVLAGVAAVALALRVHGIGAESAWLDEAFSITIAREGLEAIRRETALDVHPPLYYYLLWGWTQIAGGSVPAARLFSAVVSTGTVAAAAGVGARLAGWRVGLMGAALLAVSPFQIEYGQEARMYALLTCFATLSTYGFIRLFDAPPRRGWFLFYVAATALMAYTHVYGQFVIGGQGIAVLADFAWRRRAARDVVVRWIAAMTLVFAAFLPWLAVFIWQVTLVQHGFWIADPEWTGMLGTFSTYAGSGVLAAVFGALVIVGIVASWRRPAPARLARHPLFFLLPWLLAPILFPFLLSLLGSPIFMPKYTIVASVPFALLSAVGLAAIPFAPVRVVVVVACLASSLATLPAWDGVLKKDGWREAVATIEPAAGPGDLIVLYPYFNQIPFRLYLERADLVVRPFPLFTPPPPEDGWPAVMHRAVGSYDRVWFVALRNDSSAEPVVAQFRGLFEERSRQTIQKIAIYRFERRP